jgi:hypothetical protein
MMHYRSCSYQWDAATLTYEQIFSPLAASLAFVRPTHQLQGRFDVSPNFGLFVSTLLFAGASLLSGLGNCLVTMCLEQLPRVVVDFDFSHSHGIMLPFLRD